MIIDITIANFRSIKDKQTFSLYAESQSKHLEENIVYPGDGKYGVYRTAGIYGSNASGKSNLLLAFHALQDITTSSGDLKDGDDISSYEPYLLSKSTVNSPVEIEVEFFLKDNLRYIYSVTYIKNEILTESLDYYPSRAKANLFKREKSDTWEDISFGSHYKGGKKKYPLFKNNSYLSKAGNSADSPKVIRDIFNYFRNDIFHLGSEQKMGAFGWKKDPKLVQSIANILKEVDTGIVGLEFEDNKKSMEDFNFPDSFPDKLKKKFFDELSKETLFSHLDDEKNIYNFSEKLESSGTRKLLSMLPVLIETFADGGILILDELDNSFHPHIAELIIKLFNCEEVNENNAQLIFSTHNINLMSPKLFRREQIWFTEKNDGQTKITSLEDFNKNIVKMDSPFNKWYDEGRFGAIPDIDFHAISRIISDRVKQDA